MEKKEFHKANLPHFQVPGQSFFVTWNLKDAIPAKALKEYTSKLEFQKNIISNAIQQNQSREQIDKLKFEYNLLRKKMIKAFDDYMHLHQTPGISLSTQLNTTATLDALLFWEDKKLKNYAREDGKSEEEIAAITEPVYAYEFIANGVLIEE